MLVVEDVHWASEPLVELLEHLVDTLADTAVLIVCTSRPELFETRRSWGGGLHDATSIRLSALPDDESVELVEALLGSDGVPRELVRRVVARAEGNPFHVEEILQMLIDRGAIAREKGCSPAQLALAWVLARGSDVVPIPGTKRRTYLDENLGALAVRLAPEDLRRIDEVAPPGVAAGARYPEFAMAVIDR